MRPKWKTWTNHFLSIKFLTNQIKESSIFLSVVFFFYPTNQTDLKLVTKQWGIIIELWRWEATDSVETFDGGTTDLLTCREWGIWIPLLRVKSIQVNNVRVSCHLSLSSHGGRLLNALEAYVPKGIDIISISISGNHNMFFILFCLVRSESMFSFLFLVRSWYDSAKSNLFFFFFFFFFFILQWLFFFLYAVYMPPMCRLALLKDKKWLYSTNPTNHNRTSWWMMLYLN